MTTWDPDLPVLMSGGRVVTAAGTAPWTEAVVIRGRRILAVGRASDLSRRYPDALGIDVLSLIHI